MDLLVPTLWIGGLGLLCGAALAIAARYFSVEEDPRIAEVEGLLPGANCGGCGFAGCADYAKAIVEQGAATNLCMACSAEGIQQISAIMGVAAGEVIRRRAVVQCLGTHTASKRRFDYNGLIDCASAHATAGGDKACTYGCLGYGSCVRVCPVHAITIEDGLARVNPAACIGCGKCVAACPRHLIALVPLDAPVVLLCKSKAKGPDVRKQCTAGCLGCSLCARMAPESFSMEGALAVLDYANPPANADAIIEKCPGKCIRPA
ncbi:MAG: RnfABCDGE type electron transport complex subunit B [Kiritimatiellia bacterium]|jgi:electron transport complex protein RnfB